MHERAYRNIYMLGHRVPKTQDRSTLTYQKLAKSGRLQIVGAKKYGRRKNVFHVFRPGPFLHHLKA